MKLQNAAALAHIQKPPMLIEDIIPKGSITMVVGPTYSTKTFFAMEAARSVAFNNQPFMGRWSVVEGGNVLFSEQDSPPWDTGRAFWALIREDAARLEAQGDGSHLLQALQFAWHQGLDLKNDTDAGLLAATGLKLYTPKGFATTSGDMDGEQPEQVELGDHGVKLIVLDTFRAHHSTDENNSTEGEAVMQRIKKVRDLTGAAIILIHHATKGSNYRNVRGTTAYEAAADTIFEIRSKTPGTATVKVTKARAIQPPNWTYHVTTEETPEGLVKRVLAEGEDKIIVRDGPKPTQMILLDYLRQFRQSLGQPATFIYRKSLDPWAEEHGIYRDKLNRWLRALERQGHILRDAGKITLTQEEEKSTLSP